MLEHDRKHIVGAALYGPKALMTHSSLAMLTVSSTDRRELTIDPLSILSTETTSVQAGPRSPDRISSGFSQIVWDLRALSKYLAERIPECRCTASLYASQTAGVLAPLAPFQRRLISVLILLRCTGGEPGFLAPRRSETSRDIIP